MSPGRRYFDLLERSRRLHTARIYVQGALLRAGTLWAHGNIGLEELEDTEARLGALLRDDRALLAHTSGWLSSMGRDLDCEHVGAVGVQVGDDPTLSVVAYPDAPVGVVSNARALGALGLGGGYPP